MLASLAGTTITAISSKSSRAQERRIPHQGNKPTWASPASRWGDFPRAGPIAVTNSSHREGHSTRRLGASFTLGLPVPGQSQFRPRWWSEWKSKCCQAAPAQKRHAAEPERDATASDFLPGEQPPCRHRDKPHQWGSASRKYARRAKELSTNPLLRE